MPFPTLVGILFFFFLFFFGQAAGRGEGVVGYAGGIGEKDGVISVDVKKTSPNLDPGVSRGEGE